MTSGATATFDGPSTAKEELGMVRVLNDGFRHTDFGVSVGVGVGVVTPVLISWRCECVGWAESPFVLRVKAREEGAPPV